MKIKEISIGELKIPFKQSFSHASATRKMTQAVLVKVKSYNGLIGFGEGCPRSYVTGESTKTAQQFFEDHKAIITNIENLGDIKEWLQTNRIAINENPAACCAIELALLDLLGKNTQQSIESLLGLPELSGAFRYTAILGVSGLESYKKQLRQYSHLGFADYKIKISGKLEEDKQKICLLNQLGEGIRVRLDANNFWENAEQAINYIEALNYPLFAVEEPLKANDYDGCRSICNVLKVPTIIDESFLRLEQFEHISYIPNNWIINLRISKMGGILRSLAIAEKARELGVPIIIGAQVGETSILTRSALTVANAYRDILLAQEGAFGTHLLEHDIVKQPIIFGKNGIIKATFFDNGLGFTM